MNPSTADGNQNVSQRYVQVSSLAEGDRVIVCTCESRIATWRHGYVEGFDRYPVRVEPDGRYYAVRYPCKGTTEMGYFNPAACQVLYDTLLSAQSR